MKKRRNNSPYILSITFILLSAALLTLAAAPAGKKIEQKSAAPAAFRAGIKDDFAGLVDIGRGRKMYLECHGTGSPTVVLVSGKGNRADIWSTPNPEKPGPVVFREVARLTRVCAYDRPGTTGALASEPSRSDPVPEPVTVADAVVDLHDLLIASKEPGPFVLVGHSIGGLITRLYASTYPTDVSGLVLVDALSEDLYKRLTPEQQAVFEKLNDVPEKYDNVRSFEQVRAAPSVRAMPVVVLTADRPPITAKDIASGRFPPGVTAKFVDALWAAQVPAQDSLARLFPNAKHITNTNSSHYIQIEQPQLVIDSIREVVDAVRNSGASPRNEAGNELPPIAESYRIVLEKAFTKSGLPRVITGLSIFSHLHKKSGARQVGSKGDHLDEVFSSSVEKP